MNSSTTYDNNRIIEYVRKTMQSSIIEIYGEYVVGANCEVDLRHKKKAIDSGQILGFYLRQRILDIIHSQII